MFKKQKKVLLFLLSFLVLCAIFLLVGSSITQADENEPGLIASQLAPVYKKALSSPLEKASSEATDPEIAQFTSKLVQAYKLDQTADQSTDGDLASLLPDIKTIEKTAMDSMLKEAGKQLNDKELSDFYNSFIQGIGVE